ncbi:MAG: hypothetical protein H6934_03645 [Burkholderiaceae bacterium]|nr:hypothetical protein [Burkholderiaceae bacterium]
MIASKRCFVVVALLVASSAPSIASAACKVKFGFKNSFDSVIRIRTVDTLFGGSENLQNKRILSGGEWTSSRRNLGHPTVASRAVQPGGRMRVNINFDVWDASNRVWRTYHQQSPNEIRCPDGRTIFTDLRPDRAAGRR